MAGLQFGLGFAKLFSGGKDLAKPRLTFVFAFCPRGGGVWGGIRAGFSDFFAGGLIIIHAHSNIIFTPNGTCAYLLEYANISI